MGILTLMIAAGLLGAARFSVRPAHTYRLWLVALVATELGHTWVLLAATLALVAARAAWLGTTGAYEPWANVATALLAGVAAALFARPVWLASRLRKQAEADLAAVFGPWPRERPPAPGASATSPASRLGPASRSASLPAVRPEKLWSWRRLARWPTQTERVEVTHHHADGLPLDFYPARGQGTAGHPASASSAPCVILVHGGGWDSGDRTQLVAFNHWLAARGVAVATLSYRLAPAHPWPAQEADVRAGVAWVRANAVQLGIDPERLTLVGRSAGAQIATATAYGQPLPGVRAVVALYGCFDLEFVWSIRSATDSLNSDRLMKQFLGGPPEGERAALFRSGSAEKLVHAGVPPTLIIHGALDQLVWCRHSERLANALAGVGVPHVFLRLPWGTHAGEANLHGPTGQLITGAVLRVAHAVLPVPE